jgi:hypothetical protein
MGVFVCKKNKNKNKQTKKTTAKKKENNLNFPNFQKPKSPKEKE